MARRARPAVVEDARGEVVDWYRERLTRPGHAPWDGMGWEPSTVGPTWQRDENGLWVLPERTLGWEVLGWCGTNLQHQGEPWRFTDEQARFVLWWYELDEAGRFVWRDAILQRLKGWGKDPLGTALLAVETLGPCRFAGWAADGEPVAADNPDAWVQVAAVSLEQTKTTMRLVPGLFTGEAKRRYRLQIGKEQVYALDGRRFLQAVTSSPATLEGARSTFIVLNETHHWTASTGGLDMAAVIDRNATKSADGAARTLRLTNAYRPGERSVAEMDREAWAEVVEGRHTSTGVLYDSLEAPDDAPLTAEHAPAVIRAIRGDSVWLDVERIVQAILDRRNPPSTSRRFWFNQIAAAEDSWIAPYEWAAVSDASKVVADREVITLGFDGSRSRTRGVTDATALIACRVSDGHLFEPLERSVWEEPQGVAGEGWQAPVVEILAAVDAVFKRYRVVGFFADPALWEGHVASWEAKYGKQLAVKASRDHPIGWLMNRPSVVARAVEQFESAVLDGELSHDGSYALTRHVLAAHRRVGRSGMTIAKENPESERKIDAAIAGVLAWQARLEAVAAGVGVKKRVAVPKRIG